jgi:general secretion pathway protein I
VKNRGFSLLEVILALAILGGAIATLGEAARLALINAEFTRDMAHAQLLCESKLAEITAGITMAEPVQRAILENAAGQGEPAWLYSIKTELLDDDGLRSVRVTVTRDLPVEKHPVSFSLVRWIAESKTTSTTSPTSSDAGTEPAGTSSGTSAPGDTP